MTLPNTWSNPFRGTDILDGRVSLAVELAIAAGNSTLPHFHQRNFHVEKKADRSPVTIADREAETLIRERVKAAFSHDAILGEEFGEQSGTSDCQWIIDPIDGTKSFITGVPLYSTLVAISHQGKPHTGIIYMPALGQIAVGVKDAGAWTNCDREGCKRASVSQVSELSEAVFVTTQLDSFFARQARGIYDELEAACYVTRSWGDGYGYYLVATGRADLMVDPIVNAWDVAAVMPVVVEAGGAFTTWRGENRIDAGHAVGSNGLLHAALIERLSQAAL